MKEQLISEAWQLYQANAFQVKLGLCLRNVCKQFQTKEHSLLSKLDGNPALDYFNEKYDAGLEEQLKLI